MFWGVGQVEEGGERGRGVKTCRNSYVFWEWDRWRRGERGGMKTCRNSYVSGSGIGGGGGTWGGGGRGGTTLFAGKSALKFS